MPKFAQITMRVTPDFKEKFDAMRRKTGLSVHKVMAEALRRFGGVKLEDRWTRTEVARALKCTPATISRLIARNPDIPISGRGTRMVRLTNANVEALLERMGQ